MNESEKPPIDDAVNKSHSQNEVDLDDISRWNITTHNDNVEISTSQESDTYSIYIQNFVFGYYYENSLWITG